MTRARRTRAAAVRAAARTAVEPLERRCLLAAASLYTVTEIGTLGGPTSEGMAVNDSGQAAVSARQSAASSLFVHAARFSGGSLTDLGTLNSGDESQALGINNAGRVVGSSDARAERPHDRPVTPADLAATLFHAVGITSEQAVTLGLPMTGQVIHELF